MLSWYVRSIHCDLNFFSLIFLLTPFLVHVHPKREQWQKQFIVNNLFENLQCVRHKGIDIVDKLILILHFFCLCDFYSVNVRLVVCLIFVLFHLNQNTLFFVFTFIYWSGRGIYPMWQRQMSIHRAVKVTERKELTATLCSAASFYKNPIKIGGTESKI